MHHANVGKCAGTGRLPSMVAFFLCPWLRAETKAAVIALPVCRGARQGKTFALHSVGDQFSKLVSLTTAWYEAGGAN